MRSFREFAEGKDAERFITECAKIISEMEGRPEDILAGVVSRMDEANWLGAGLRAAGAVARGLGTAVAGAAKGVAQGAGTAAGGIGAAATDLNRQRRLDADQRSGPLAKFDNAVKMLQGLEQELRKNPATAQNLQKRSVAGYIQSIWKALQKERSSMPVMQQDGETYAQQRNQTGNQQPQQPPVQQQPQQNTGGMKFVPAAS